MLRPSVAAYRDWLRQNWYPAFVPTCLFVGLAVWSIVAGGLNAVNAALLVCGGGAIAEICLSMTTSRIVLEPGQVTHRSWFLRRIVLRGQVEGLLAPFALPGSPSRVSDVLVLRDSSGAIVRLNGAFWSHADLVTLAEHADVPVLIETLGVAQLEARLPGVLRWRERHWVVGNIVLLVGLLVGVAAVVLALLVVTGSPPFG